MSFFLAQPVFEFPQNFSSVFSSFFISLLEFNELSQLTLLALQYIFNQYPCIIINYFALIINFSRYN